MPPSGTPLVREAIAARQFPNRAGESTALARVMLTLCTPANRRSRCRPILSTHARPLPAWSVDVMALIAIVRGAMGRPRTNLPPCRLRATKAASSPPATTCASSSAGIACRRMPPTRPLSTVNRRRATAAEVRGAASPASERITATIKPRRKPNCWENGGAQ
jgi:hypothetical protein